MEEPSHAMLTKISSALEVNELSVSESFFGFSHDVFVLISTEGHRWTLRIARNEFAASLAKRSRALMGHIKMLHPSIQIPAILHTAKTYAVLEYIQGTPIGSCELHIMSKEKHHRLLDGIAAFFIQLWTCPPPPVAQSKKRQTLLT
jgi:aminoglycoside phosphotransferase (APT) family kinase protein